MENNEQKEFIDCNEINPVDYFNKNCIQECYDKLLKIRNIKSTGIDSFTYVTNKEDNSKRMVVIENEKFVAKMKNGLNLAVGVPYTPFQMLQKFVFKDNWSLALSYVLYDLMGYENNYIRVGTKYFKRIIKSDRFGIDRLELKVWDRATIVDDHGKNFLTSIQKYNDFTIEPNNKNYSSVFKGNYNMFSKFSHEAEEFKDEEQIKWTLILLRHLFGEQIKYGLEYLKVLYDHPKQALPILVLISTERQTGKSTFIDWMTILFGDNSVIINPENIKSQFNGSYSDKNIIMIEESHFDSRQATEKLKNLSTQKRILSNTKHVQESSLPFYGKIIITSNDEDKFSKVDSPEIRYWVRKVPSLKGKANHSILEDLTKEIPYFLGYLNSLDEVNLKRSRMVFDAVELKTDALEKVKLESRSELHKEIEIKLEDFCENNRDIEFIYFTAHDMKQKWFSHQNNISSSYISKTLKSDMSLYPSKKTKRYIAFEEDSSISNNKKAGKPFEYKNPVYKIEIEESNSSIVSEEDDVPF